MQRNIGDKLQLTASIQVQKASKDYGQVDVIVSNSATDRHGEKILMEGIDVTQVKKNPVVLWAHDYGNLPIGKIARIWKDNAAGNLMATIEFAYEVYDFADTVYKMVLGGFINAVSIGGAVKEFGTDKTGTIDYSIVSKLEMYELSMVPVGAHPDALVVGKDFEGANEARKQLSEFVKKAQEVEILSEVKAIRKELEDLKLNPIFKELQEEEDDEENGKIIRVITYKHI